MPSLNHYYKISHYPLQAGSYSFEVISPLWTLLPDKAIKLFFVVVIVWSLSLVWLFVIPWTAVNQARLSSTVSWSLLKFMSIESVMLSNYLILCRPLLFLPSIFPSIRVFSNELALHIRWPKYWSISFSTVFPKNIEGWFPLGLKGLISFQSKGLSRVFSSTTFLKHQFFCAQPCL